MQSRTALFRIGYTSHIASYTDRSLDNFGWAEHPADLAKIRSSALCVGFSSGEKV
jgi:hypothetical protein